MVFLAAGFKASNCDCCDHLGLEVADGEISTCVSSPLSFSLSVLLCLSSEWKNTIPPPRLKTGFFFFNFSVKASKNHYIQYGFVVGGNVLLTDGRENCLSSLCVHWFAFAAVADHQTSQGETDYVYSPTLWSIKIPHSLLTHVDRAESPCRFQEGGQAPYLF